MVFTHLIKLGISTDSHIDCETENLAFVLCKVWSLGERKVEFYSNRTKEYSIFVRENDKLYPVSQEKVKGLPGRVLEKPQILDAFLRDTYVKVQGTIDQVFSIEIFQRGSGGGGGEEATRMLFALASTGDLIVAGAACIGVAIVGTSLYRAYVSGQDNNKRLEQAVRESVEARTEADKKIKEAKEKQRITSLEYGWHTLGGDPVDTNLAPSEVVREKWHNENNERMGNKN